jgi:hypothetical protein
LQKTADAEQEKAETPLYFWAIGDLHYRAWEPWRTMHAARLAPMFADLKTLWHAEGPPAFCVSPGDLVETGAPENYQLAKQDLEAQFGLVPFYPGIGNHEFHREHAEDHLHTAEEFRAAWGKPVRYWWTAGEVVCIMLDQPNPFTQDPHRETPQVVLPQETLTFLDTTLAEHAEHPAVIFAHCPLRDTVLDRDPVRQLDDVQIPFFYVENSAEVRATLARHRQANIYITGHTHSGWGSPHLVYTETLGGHPVTHVNLMCPWYTGRHRGPRVNTLEETIEYLPDTPDLLASFGFWIYRQHAIIRVRDHRTQQWIAAWQVPL